MQIKLLECKKKWGMLSSAHFLHSRKEVSTWLLANKLTLNVAKTKYMLIGAQQKIASILRESSIVVSSNLIEHVEKFKCLGITLDQTLSWEQHIEEITLKVSRDLGALKRIRPNVPQPTLITIYNTIILPYFDYCSTVWGSRGICQSEKLQKLQNRAARIVTRSTYESRSADLLQVLEWENLGTRREKQLATTL